MELGHYHFTLMVCICVKVALQNLLIYIHGMYSTYNFFYETLHNMSFSIDIEGQDILCITYM